MTKAKQIDVLNALSGKWEDGTRPKDLYSQHVQSKPQDYVAAIISGLSCGDSRVENGCAELASLVAEEFPNLVYPYVQLFIGNINAREKVIRWEAVCVLGSLAAVDANKVIVPFIPRISTHLRDKSIVLAGHALRALSKMAVAYPEKSRDIFEEFIAVADAFPGNKIGFLIEAMAPLGTLKLFNDDIREFVLPYKNSPLKVVSRKSVKTLKTL